MASDDDVNTELLDLLRASLANKLSPAAPSKSVVLSDAEYVYNNSIDVAIDMASTKAAAEAIYQRMNDSGFSPQTWSSHDLHPQEKDASTVDFIFALDLLNFSFWPDDPAEPFAVEYKDQKWTGYSSLLAVLWRALAEGQAGRPLELRPS